MVLASNEEWKELCCLAQGDEASDVVARPAPVLYLLLLFLFKLLQLYRSHCICHKIFHLFLIVFFQASQILRELNKSRACVTRRCRVGSSA